MGHCGASKLKVDQVIHLLSVPPPIINNVHLPTFHRKRSYLAGCYSTSSYFLNKTSIILTTKSGPRAQPASALFGRGNLAGSASCPVLPSSVVAFTLLDELDCEYVYLYSFNFENVVSDDIGRRTLLGGTLKPEG